MWSPAVSFGLSCGSGRGSAWSTTESSSPGKGGGLSTVLAVSHWLGVAGGVLEGACSLQHGQFPGEGGCWSRGLGGLGQHLPEGMYTV